MSRLVRRAGPLPAPVASVPVPSGGYDFFGPVSAGIWYGAHPTANQQGYELAVVTPGMDASPLPAPFTSAHSISGAGWFNGKMVVTGYSSVYVGTAVDNVWQWTNVGSAATGGTGLQFEGMFGQLGNGSALLLTYRKGTNDPGWVAKTTDLVTWTQSRPVNPAGYDNIGGRYVNLVWATDRWVRWQWGAGSYDKDVWYAESFDNGTSWTDKYIPRSLWGFATTPQQKPTWGAPTIGNGFIAWPWTTRPGGFIYSKDNGATWREVVPSDYGANAPDTTTNPYLGRSWGLINGDLYVVSVEPIQLSRRVRSWRFVPASDSFVQVAESTYPQDVIFQGGNSNYRGRPFVQQEDGVARAVYGNWETLEVTPTSVALVRSPRIGLGEGALFVGHPWRYDG